MAKTKEEYLREKGRLPVVDLGVMYAFESNRKGVGEIKEILIYEQTEGEGWRGDPTEACVLKKYKYKESPYESTFWPGDIVVEDRGCGSGFGDLWSWSWFTSTDIKALELKRKEEHKRIKTKYIKK